VLCRGLLAALVLAVIAAGLEPRLSRGAPAAWVFESPEMRFKYGSIGAEHDAGIPYWIFYVLPRVFPEKFRQDGEIAPAATRPSAWPGSRARSCRSASPRRPSASPGGQQLRRLPHRQLPHSPDANPVFVVGGPGHTLNIQNFFRL
jgi:hypothetical protein